MNIFTRIHTDREGNETPIISMGADHLIAFLNLILIKNVRRLVGGERNERMKEALRGYAPAGMSEKQRIVLRLKPRPSQDEINALKEKFDAELDELESDAIESALEFCNDYIIVGVCRDDTREGVVKILQQVTGITGHIDLPDLISKAMPQNPLLGTGEGLVSIHDPDYDPYGFGEMDRIDDVDGWDPH